MDKYDYVFRWMKNATKAERHIDEMEAFAKKHPIIFWKFHRASKGIIENDVNDEKYEIFESECVIGPKKSEWISATSKEEAATILGLSIAQ